MMKQRTGEERLCVHSNLPLYYSAFVRPLISAQTMLEHPLLVYMGGYFFSTDLHITAFPLQVEYHVRQ